MGGKRGVGIMRGEVKTSNVHATGHDSSAFTAGPGQVSKRCNVRHNLITASNTVGIGNPLTDFCLFALVCLPSHFPEYFT